MVSLEYLDQGYDSRSQAAWGERVEAGGAGISIKGERDSSIKRDKGPGRETGQHSGELRPDETARILLERSDALKPKISFCGLYFWVIMSSSPSRTRAHAHILLCLRTVNRGKLWRVKPISLRGIHLLQTEQENYRKFHNQAHISRRPRKPCAVSMGHATWEHFWKSREEQSKALGIIRHLWQLSKARTLDPDLWKVCGGLLARLEVTKLNGKILCALSLFPLTPEELGSPRLWLPATTLNPKTHGVLAQPFPVPSNNHGNEIPAKMKGADFH